jgi:shikimate dehydrogenase
MADHYAVIGNPVGHSQSPRIHALFAEQCRQHMDYSALLAPLDGFAATVRQFATDGGRGANVTVPFKEEAYRLAETLTPRAKAARAVNTVSFEQGRIAGDNTDGAGLIRDLMVNRHREIQGKRVLLLGAGGAARGVVLPLLSEQPALLAIANRDSDKAARLAEDFPGTGASGFADLAGQSFDLVINATSAGLTGAELPLPPGIFAAGGLAYEMLYGRQTPFMARAGDAGAEVADGLGMLVEQAAEAFLVWRGMRPDTAPILAALKNA